MAIPIKLNLEIVTPERQVFSGSVEQVTVPGEDGAMGIMPGHAALISKLGVGVLSYRYQGESIYLFCSQGFVEVLPDAVSVLADKALSRTELNAQQAQQEKTEAESLLKSAQEEKSVEAARRLYHEAVAKLDVLSR